MRIRLEGLGPLLTELLGGRQVLLGQVQRLTAASVLLRFGQEEVELALEELSPELQAALGEGVAVELHRSQGAVSYTHLPVIQHRKFDGFRRE